jgi:Uma2 family endonuclease
MTLTAEQFEALMPDVSQLDSDEPEMESSLHAEQLLVLVTCLQWLWRERHDFFIGYNLTIYFSRQQLKSRDFRGPDLFLVKQTEQRPRRSWVVWEEDGKYPDLIIELLSDSTASVDRTLKKELYQDRFRTPEYFWFSPDTLELAGFRLIGHQYEAIAANESGWLWSEELNLFLGIHDQKLRYFTLECDLVPTPTEASLQERQRANQERQRAEQERQRANQERQRANQERQRADRLAAQLQALGINPEEDTP